MDKGHWPNLGKLILGKVGLNLGERLGSNYRIAPRALVHLEGADWKLSVFKSIFYYRLPIHYFSAVMGSQTQQKFEIHIR